MTKSYGTISRASQSLRHVLEHERRRARSRLCQILTFITLVFAILTTINAMLTSDCFNKVGWKYVRVNALIASIALAIEASIWVGYVSSDAYRIWRRHQRNSRNADKPVEALELMLICVNAGAKEVMACVCIFFAYIYGNFSDPEHQRHSPSFWACFVAVCAWIDTAHLFTIMLRQVQCDTVGDVVEERASLVGIADGLTTVSYESREEDEFRCQDGEGFCLFCERRELRLAQLGRDADTSDSEDSDAVSPRTHTHTHEK